jgi:hypothetical protein
MSRLTLQLRRSSVGVAVATVVIVFGFQAVSTAPATAAANAFPREVRGAFPTGTGKGFWLAYANGEVANVGDAPFFGDARYLALTGPARSTPSASRSPSGVTPLPLATRWLRSSPTPPVRATGS